MTIYPEVIVTGDLQSPPNDFEETLKSWHNQMIDERAKERIASANQFRLVKQRVPQLLGQLKEKPFVLVAVFEDSSGDEALIKLWFLSNKMNNPSLLRLDSTDMIKTSLASRYHVSSEGKVAGKYIKDKDLVEQFVFLKTELNGRLDFVLIHGSYDGHDVKKYSDNEWKIRISPKDIITNEDLINIGSEENE